MKSLVINSNGERQSKISLKENGVVSFDSKKNAYTFCRFFFLKLSRLNTTKISTYTKKDLESKPLEGIMNKFEISVKILLYTF